MSNDATPATSTQRRMLELLIKVHDYASGWAVIYDDQNSFSLNECIDITEEIWQLVCSIAIDGIGDQP